MKVLRIAAVAAVLAAVLPAAAYATGAGERSSSAQAGEVSVMVYERGWVVPEEGTIENSRWTKWMAESSGVKVKWVAVQRAQVVPTLNTMFAAGTAPDLIHDFPRSTIATFRTQGVLRPVDDLVSSYSTAYRQYLAKNPELVPYVTFDDGKMWAFSSMRPVDSIANHTVWLRKDWLDKLGRTVPQTEADFVSLMDAFVKNDPDGNGKADTFAFSAMPAMEPIIDALNATHNIWYVEGGKVTYRVNTERYEARFRIPKLAFDRGWLDPEFVTDTNSARANQQWVTGRAGVAFGGLTPPLLDQLRANVPTAQLVPIRPFQTQYGRNGLLDEPPAHRFVGVNKDVKYPELAVKFLDWMINKGWYTLTYGIEGQQMQLVNGRIPKNTLSADDTTKIMRYAFEYVLLDQRYVEPSWIPVMAAPDVLSQEIAKLKAQALEISLLDNFRRDLPYEPTSDEVTRFFADFNPIEKDIRTRVIIGGASETVAGGVQRAREEWKRLGGDKITALYQDWYEKNKANFKK